MGASTYFQGNKVPVGPHFLRGLSWEEVREWDYIKSFLLRHSS